MLMLLFVGAALAVPISLAQAQPPDPPLAPDPTQKQDPAFQGLVKAADRAATAGRLEEAEDEYRKALALAPPEQKWEVRLSLGLFYMSREQAADVIKGVEEFKNIVDDPTSSKDLKMMIRELLGIAYSSLDRNEEAREEYSTILADGAETPELKERLRFFIAQTYLYEQRYPEARDAMNKFLALPSESKEYFIPAQISIGTTYIGEGNYAAAIDQYKEVLALPTPAKVSQQQMFVTRFKQQAQLGLVQAYIGQALQSEQEVLKSKYLPAETEAEARKNAEAFQKLRDDFLNQLRGRPQAKPDDAPVKAPIKVGELAPDFTLVDSSGKTQRLSDYRGKKQVLLTFSPKCFTGGCKNHLSTLRDSQDEFEANNVQILAVSVDPAQGPQGQLAFAKQWGFEFPMLPDTDRKLSMLYGAAQTPTDVASRRSVLIGTDGLIKIVDSRVNVTTHATDVLAKMKTLNLVAKRP